MIKRECLLIPGNPAIERDYKLWMQEIQDRNKDVHITYATSYVLFDKKLNYSEYNIAMRRHYEELFLQLHTAEKITIIAHSAGSYFACRLLEKHADRIEKIIIIFPYIGYSDFKILEYVSIPYVLDRFFPLVEILSHFKNLFKKWEKDILSISSKELVANLRFGLRQCRYFNKNKLDLAAISMNKQKMYFMYTKNDKWCPTKTIELLKPISHHKELTIPHDFIAQASTREKMTDEIMPILLR